MKIVAIVWKIGFALPFHHFCENKRKETGNVSSNTDFQDAGNKTLNLPNNFDDLTTLMKNKVYILIYNTIRRQSWTEKPLKTRLKNENNPTCINFIITWKLSKY